MWRNYGGLIICILMVLVGSVLICKQIKIANNTQEVIATVGDHSGLVGRKELNNTYYITYNVDGKQYNATYESDRRLSKGQEIKVKVGKDDPDIVEQGSLLAPIALIMMGLFYGFACIMKIYNKDTV